MMPPKASSQWAWKYPAALENIDMVCSKAVSDDGPGFKWQAETEILHHDRDETGRGLQIFASYASLIKFNDTGNCVTLTLILNAQQNSQGEYDD